MATRRTVLAGGMGLATMLAGFGIARRAGAQDASPAASDCAPMSAEEMDTLARNWVNAWEVGDGDFFKAITSGSYQHHSGGVHKQGGKANDVAVDGLVAQVEAMASAIPDKTMTVEYTVVQDNWVAAVWTASGVQSGTMYDIPASEKTVTWTGVTILDVECGMIQESWSEWDALSYIAQVTGKELPPPNPASNPATPEGFVEGVCAPMTPADALTVMDNYWTTTWMNGMPTLEQLDTVTSLYIRLHMPGGLDSTGQPAYLGGIQAWRTAMPDLVMTPLTRFTDGMHGVQMWQASGTMSGKFQDKAPSGKKVTWSGVDVTRINCGKIAEVWTYIDLNSLYEQMASQG